MNKITLKAYAKINLTLDIVGVREDGYHLMDMIMQSVDLADTITIERTGKPFSIVSNLSFLPSDGRNSAYKAAQALAAAVGAPMFDCCVNIRKRIPTQAGLGGGTADAAAVLAGLDRLYGLGLGGAGLAEIAPAVGADVPFCLVGGTARVGGIGEQIEKLRNLRGCRFVIAMPRRGNSTKRVFALYDESGPGDRPDNARAAAAVAEGNVAALAAECRNSLEKAVCTEEMEHLKRRLMQRGAISACMTGSGSAVFGVFQSPRAASEAKEALRREGKLCFNTKPVAAGWQIE